MDERTGELRFPLPGWMKETSSSWLLDLRATTGTRMPRLLENEPLNRRICSSNHLIAHSSLRWPLVNDVCSLNTTIYKGILKIRLVCVYTIWKAPTLLEVVVSTISQPTLSSRPDEFQGGNQNVGQNSWHLESAHYYTLLTQSEASQHHADPKSDHLMSNQRRYGEKIKYNGFKCTFNLSSRQSALTRLKKRFVGPTIDQNGNSW